MSGLSSGYSLLVGKVLGYIPRTRTHARILLDVKGDLYEASVNCSSKISPNELKVSFVQDTVEFPVVTSELSALAFGRYDKGTSLPSSLLLDYPTLVSEAVFEIYPVEQPGVRNDMDDFIRRLVGESLVSDLTSNRKIYIFGECWDSGPDSTNRSFGFKHDRGIHNIHMNQGNQAPYEFEDATHQDGAILIEKENGLFDAMFSTFQTQVWPNTDDVVAVLMTEMLANSPQDTTDEWIQISNTGPSAVDISGWKIVEDSTFVIPAHTILDSGKHYVIAKNLAGFQALYSMAPDAVFPALALGNRGDMIQLKNSSDVSMDTFEYGGTKNDRSWRRKRDDKGMYIMTDSSFSDWEVGPTLGTPNNAQV